MSLPRILAIDDNTDDLLLLKVALTQELGDHHFEILMDGEAALAFIEEHRSGLHPPDPCVIVLDLHLPKHTGLTVLKAVRQSPALDHIQVLVVSSMTSKQVQEQIHAEGAVFREKPCDLEGFGDLAVCIADLCRNGVARG
ncbi:MAG: response regulator [Acidobacteriota bacterium]